MHTKYMKSVCIRNGPHPHPNPNHLPYHSSYTEASLFCPAVPLLLISFTTATLSESVL